MFIVTAPYAAAAQEWGDRLARTRFPLGQVQEFAWSLVVPVAASITPGLSMMAVVDYGRLASDAEIGW